jgi:hypothetical protein
MVARDIFRRAVGVSGVSKFVIRVEGGGRDRLKRERTAASLNHNPEAAVPDAAKRSHTGQALLRLHFSVKRARV